MIELDGLCKTYGNRAVVDNFSLEIPSGKITILIGPSGCGKSTTLRMINRLILPDSGAVWIDGVDVASQQLETLRRGIGYAIQGVGLFPHWSVAKNIAAVPALLGWPKARSEQRVGKLLTLLGLPPEIYAEKMPASLSGGQQQRVGIARALAADPPILLMDEPFGALDPVTRRDLQLELRRIQAETGKTILLVTHDMDEALFLGDRIALMNHGKLAQFGTPAEILQSPASSFVRDFVQGEAAGLRLLAVRRVADCMRAADGKTALSIGAQANLREALGKMAELRCDRLDVQDEHGKMIGQITLADIFK